MHLQFDQSPLDRIGTLSIREKLLDAYAFANFGMHKHVGRCISVCIHSAGIEILQIGPLVRPVGKFADNLLFDRGHIDRADNDDFDPVGTVPFSVECAHPLCRGRFKNILLPDGIARCEIGVRVKEIVRRPRTLEAEIFTLALFRNDDPTFGVDRAFVKENLACRFPHQKQGSFEQSGIGAGQVELILGLRIAGGRIGVGAKGKPQPFEHFDHLPFGDVGRTVERHMLYEMGQTLFVLGFGGRAEIDGHTHDDLVLRALVWPDRVPDAVGQSAVDYARIRFQIRGFGIPWGRPLCAGDGFIRRSVGGSCEE